MSIFWVALGLSVAVTMLLSFSYRINKTENAKLIKRVEKD